METSRHEGLDILEGAVEGLDPGSDRQRFMETHPTAFTPPTRFTFQPHMGDQVRRHLVSKLYTFKFIILFCFENHFYSNE